MNFKKQINILNGSFFAHFFVNTILGLALFIAIKKFVLEPISHGSSMTLFCFVLVCLSSIFFNRLKMPKSWLMLHCGISITLSVYLMFAFPTIPLDGYPSVISWMLSYGGYMAALIGLIGCYYYFLSLVPVAVIIWQKGILSQFIGVTISYTDYLPLLEIALFLLCIYIALIITHSLLKSITNTIVSLEDYFNTMEQLILCCFSVHMANYFYSGLKKINLGDHFFSWVIENHTPNLFLVAKELGQLPIEFSEHFSSKVYEILSATVIQANTVTLLCQLIAIAALVRIRWGIIITVIYDITHLVIFLVSGIFFYKWILLNAALLATLGCMKNVYIRKDVILLLIGLMFVSPNIFFVAKLGWWDTPSLNVEKLNLINSEGREIVTPSNFFGSYSVVFAQQRISRLKETSDFPTGTYGVIFGQENKNLAENCFGKKKEIDRIRSLRQDDKSKEEIKRLRSFITGYLNWLNLRYSSGNDWYYNFFPHHIFSFPFKYPNLTKADLSDIVGFRYKVYEKCLGYENGNFTSNLVGGFEYDASISK